MYTCLQKQEKVKTSKLLEQKESGRGPEVRQRVSQAERRAGTIRWRDNRQSDRESVETGRCSVQILQGLWGEVGTGEQEGEEGQVMRADGVSAAPEGVDGSETTGESGLFS